jgi:polynucleotide 5'-hydroxyl-kinase GRC3/NOL9
MEIIPGPSWENLFRELLVSKKTVFFLGTTDSGKSTLIRHLVERFLAEGVTVSLIDSDVGQSALGLPGSISMKVFHAAKDLDPYRAERMSYVGVVNPAMAIRAMIETTRKMAGDARRLSRVTLFDTTGLVGGEAGKALKIGKIRAVRPDCIVALQRDEEVEHILALAENIPVHRLRVSPMAKIRSQEFRARYRREKLADYFKGKELTESLLTAGNTGFVFKGRPIDLRASDLTNFRNTIVGLNHDDETIALGTVTEITDESMSILSPLESLRAVNRIVLGEITLG